MCSILVFVKNNPHPDPKQQWRKFGPGDVIDGNDDDNFYWGDDIQGPKALGWWRVVVVPGVPWSKLAGLTTSEVLERQDLPDAPRKLRINKIDIAALEQQAASVKGAPIEKAEAVQIAEADVLAVIEMKPATLADGTDAIEVVKG